MSFNPNITEITNYALRKLKGKTFGGVSKESAAEAVERGVSEAIRQGQNAIGQVRKCTCYKTKLLTKLYKSHQKKT